MTRKSELSVNQILCGDCIQVMNEFPKASVDLVVTSPPYWGLRDYGVDGQIGLEDHPNQYIESLVLVAHKLGRKWIGIDLNKEYCELAEKRLQSVGAFSKKLMDFNLVGL